jgi:hypothetical protein
VSRPSTRFRIPDRGEIEEEDMGSRILGIGLAMLLVSSAARAQAGGEGWLTAGPIAAVSSYGGGGTLVFGGGGESMADNHVGIAGDLAILPAGRDWVPLLSVSTNYHFAGGHHAKQAVPFVGGGYTLGLGVTVEGGVTVWGQGRTGLRVEVRDVVIPRGWDGANIFTVRVGLAFR